MPQFDSPAFYGIPRIVMSRYLSSGSLEHQYELDLRAREEEEQKARLKREEMNDKDVNKASESGVCENSDAATLGDLEVWNDVRHLRLESTEPQLNSNSYDYEAYCKCDYNKDKPGGDDDDDDDVKSAHKKYDDVLPEITCSPSPCVFDDCIRKRPFVEDSRLSPSRSSNRSSSSRSPSPSPRRRSLSPYSQGKTSPVLNRRGSSTPTGYELYQTSLLEVPYPLDYGDASSDDLSSEWDSDAPEPPKNTQKASGWRKLRNIVQWTPFFQTYKKQRYPWVQLAGHQGNFKAGPDQGTILKKLCSKEEKCFKILMKDRLRPYVPEYKGLITSDDGDCSYLQLQDLLGDFVSPCVMDCKIGVRTYLEEELAKAKEKPKLRKDMYEKMCQIDPNAPTDEEHRLKGVTKPRYMVWRETISSTATLGFRIEGIRKADGSSTKDFKTTRTKEQILDAFAEFTGEFPHSVPKYIQRLKAIKATLESSDFFNSHEVIGSSLLFVHDKHTANVWLIDFAKTILLPSDVQIDHNSKWKVGNHEDGYMIGINNLINLFKTLLERQPVFVSPPECLPDPPLDIDEDETKTETEKTSTNDKNNHHKEDEESIHTTNQKNLEID